MKILSQVTIVLFSVIQLTTLLAFADSYEEESNFKSAYEEAKEEFVGNEMVVLNDITGNVVVALCPNRQSRSHYTDINNCEIKFFGTYEYLCHRRKTDLSIFRGLKFASGILLGVLNPISLPLIVNLAGWGYTGWQTKEQVETQYEIWTSTCSGSDNITKEDEIFELIWKLHMLEPGKAHVFNQEDAIEYYSQFIGGLGSNNYNIINSQLGWKDGAYQTQLDYSEARYIDPETGANGRPRVAEGQEVVKPSNDSFN